MKLANINGKRKITPKLSALLIALSSAFFVVACGGGGSAVGSDSADSVKSSNDNNSSAGTGAGTGTGTGTVKKDDDDDEHCSTTPTPVPAPAIAVPKDKDGDDDEDDDDDDKKCSTPTTPPVATATGALGKIAWTANCASCHTGNLGRGRNANETMEAIRSNEGGVMRVLSGKVTAVDAANIAEYTKNPSLYP
jgi:hypothetical protein